jgi:hypothetical protein
MATLHTCNAGDRFNKIEGKIEELIVQSTTNTIESKNLLRAIDNLNKSISDIKTSIDSNFNKSLYTLSGMLGLFLIAQQLLERFLK